MSGSSQDRESPHFYLVILHAGAVLEDFMPYPAPDGVAADFLRAGDAAAEGDVQRIPFQGAELIADAPPVVAAQGDAAVLDDRAAAVSLFCPQPHKSSTAMRTKDKAFIFTFECSPSLPGLLMLIIP